MNTETENAGHRSDDHSGKEWAQENSIELDKPLTNRAFLLGCSMLAETILFAWSKDDSGYDSWGPKEWQSTLSLLKKTFIEGWRGDETYKPTKPNEQ
jgi:hypothetical protein